MKRFWVSSLDKEARMHSVNYCRPKRSFQLVLGIALLLFDWIRVEAASTLPGPTRPLATRVGHIFLRFPVTWEMQRSGFNTLDVALESESYAEYWAILYLSPDEIELMTPRGRTSVVGIRSQTETPANYPDILVVSEAEFSRLLGLEVIPLGSSEKLIMLELPLRENIEQSLALKGNLKYFVSIQLSMSF